MRASFMDLTRTLRQLCLSVVFCVANGTGAQAAEPICRSLTVHDDTFTVCDIDLQRHVIELHWKGADGQPFGTLSGFTGQFAPGSKPSSQPSSQPGAPAKRTLVFAMNAGMYHHDLTPVGLYVENGHQLVRANTRRGVGNFHMMPNGVFYLGGGQAGVLETSRYLKSGRKDDFATQSGPMLVIDGKLHPQFPPVGQSQKIRNGVGVPLGNNRAVFAVSDAPVTFTAFAKLFRDQLNCPNALFLDGSISSLHAPSVNRADGFWPVGPIVSAFEK
jgi:uncharacterized protein YigE (DUF2233 family)